MSSKDDIRRKGGDRVSLREDGCFVCGSANPIGFQLEFEYDRENKRSNSLVTFREEHQGWDGIVHGGLLGTILDDAMAHAVMTTGKFGITTRLNLTFRKPVRTGETVYIEGEVLQMKAKIAKTRGMVYTLDGKEGEERNIKCEAEAVYYLDAPAREG